MAEGAAPAPLLLVLGGLPATGKSTVARAAAAQLGAVWLRIDTVEIDTVEQAARASAAGSDTVRAAVRAAVGQGLGYDLTRAVARDLLRQRFPVLAECVNPLPITREGWRADARDAGARLVEVELICSDPVEHRRRVETRTVDVPGLRLPTWDDVQHREFAPWTATADGRAPLVLDTATATPTDLVAGVVAAAAGG